VFGSTRTYLEDKIFSLHESMHREFRNQNCPDDLLGTGVLQKDTDPMHLFVMTLSGAVDERPKQSCDQQSHSIEPRCIPGGAGQRTRKSGRV